MLLDVPPAKLDGDFARAELQTLVEQDIGEHERLDFRRPPHVARLDVGLVTRHRRVSQYGGDDRAIGEHAVAGDVVEVPVAKHHGELADSEASEIVADERGLRVAREGVVDNRLATAVDRIHGGAERHGRIVEPVPFRADALIRLPSGVEGDQVGRLVGDPDGGAQGFIHRQIPVFDCLPLGSEQQAASDS